MAIVVSDFRDKSEYISFHSDLIHEMNKAKIPGGGVLKLQGTKILLQNHKSLLPYGYPFAYVENIHHQYVLIFRKEKKWLQIHFLVWFCGNSDVLLDQLIEDGVHFDLNTDRPSI